MSAIRLARAATGREKLLKFAGAYHGHVDGLLAEAGSRPRHAGDARRARACPRRSAATRSSCRGTTPRRCVAATARARVRRDPRRALPGEHGPRPAAPRASSSCCASAPTQTGALLVFDEVITGFRVAPRRRPGADRRPARPDGARQGHRRRPARRRLRRPRELMERVAPAGDVYQAGTLSGNPLAVAAALATLAHARRAGLRCASHATTERARRRAARGGRRPCRSRSRARTGPADGLLHRRARRATTRARTPATPSATPRWCRALLARGVYPPPSQFEAWFPSLAHTAEHVERTLEAAAAAFAELT